MFQGEGYELFRDDVNASEEEFEDDEGNMISGVFTGSLVKTKVPADGHFIYDNKFYYSNGSTNIKAFRAWLELGAVLDKETDFEANVRYVIDGEVTSIEGLPSAADQSGAVYTLKGQLVGYDVDMKTLPAGIYLVNGKKVIVK